MCSELLIELVGRVVLADGAIGSYSKDRVHEGC